MRFDEWGRDGRTVEEIEKEETAGPKFSRLFVGAFAVAALIGVVLGLVWTIAGLWHFHVSPLF